MAITSTEVADILGMTTVNAKYPQVVALLPYIQVQINDYCGGGFSRQVKEEPVNFTSTTMVQMGNYPVVKGSVYVTTTNRGFSFYGDTQFGNVPNPTYFIPSSENRDYELSYSTGGISAPTTISRILSGTIPHSSNTLVTYSFVDLIDGGKPACARLIAQAINQSAGGVVSESVGPLSRTYAVGLTGMDEFAKVLLAPYKRPRVI